MAQGALVPADKLFRAFADGTRLRILYLLHRGELNVCDLVQAMCRPQPTISRHLAYLRRLGLVRTREEGAWKYYSLVEPHNPFHAKLLECLSTCFADAPELERDGRRRKRDIR